ncbi:hypothetical protein [Parasitella parasitica]|uniref:Uncharacterized protein n=1 Tax=Parasitella parasitica TaxID=35722 RepID=A0A0B7NGT1_9FUNG|nr:hypothetical protein [Parasitella parasitica]
MSQTQSNRIEHHPAVPPPTSPVLPPTGEQQEHYLQALSRPPSYLVRHGSQTVSAGESDRLHLEAMQELAECYNRQNTRNSYLDRLLFWGTGEEEGEEEGGEKIKYRYALQSCISSQFKGTPFLIWTIVLIFVGCVSVFTGPDGAQALWVLLAVYLVFAFISFRKRRRETKKIMDLERYILDHRIQRRELLDQSHPLPEGYYFEIQNNSKDHTHPVVTLLPPPPAYAN